MRATLHMLLLMIIALLSILFILPSSVTAQCTDADGDSYYYENGCSTATDCNDANASTYLGAIEKCNGFDDDCDSDLDEGCDTSCDNPERYGADLLLTDENRWAENTGLIWNGNGYGVCWHNLAEPYSHAYFDILDSEGNTTIPEQPVFTGSWDCFDSSLAWTGSG